MNYICYSNLECVEPCFYLNKLKFDEWNIWLQGNGLFDVSLVKTQFHPILKQAICKRGILFKQINFLDKETKRKKKKYQPADNKIYQHLG